MVCCSTHSAVGNACYLQSYSDGRGFAADAETGTCHGCSTQCGHELAVCQHNSGSATTPSSTRIKLARYTAMQHLLLSDRIELFFLLLGIFAPLFSLQAAS
jgi:hypothetical protein